MPYGKRRVYRRYTSRKRKGFGRYRKKFSGYSKAYSARSVVKSAERKYIDFSTSGSVSTTASLVLLNALSLGDTSITRDGQTVRFCSIFGDFYTEMSSAGFATQMRILIFVDRQANATAPTAVDVLAGSAGVNSHLNLENMYRFRVIRDYRFCMSISGKNNNRIKLYKPLFFNTRYNTGNAGTIADIQTNSIYVLFVSDEATNTPTCFYNVRLRFYDI